MSELKIEVKEPNALFREIANLIAAHYRHPHQLGFHQNYPGVYHIYLNLAAMGYGNPHRKVAVAKR